MANSNTVIIIIIIIIIITIMSEPLREFTRFTRWIQHGAIIHNNPQLLLDLADFKATYQNVPIKVMARHHCITRSSGAGLCIAWPAAGLVSRITTDMDDKRPDQTWTSRQTVNESQNDQHSQPTNALSSISVGVIYDVFRPVAVAVPYSLQSPHQRHHWCCASWPIYRIRITELLSI